MPHIDADSCVLVVIDAQPGFYPSSRTDVDRTHWAAALSRCAWLCAVSTALGIPVVVTEEDSATNGPTAAAILQALSPAVPVLAKEVFGADANPSIDGAVRAHGRGTLVLVGMETDVCVAHSALGWRAAGMRVAVVHDAVYSAGEGHENGIARLVREGIELVSAKELYYEWLRALPAVRAFEAAHPSLASPPGFSL